MPKAQYKFSLHNYQPEDALVASGFTSVRLISDRNFYEYFSSINQDQLNTESSSFTVLATTHYEELVTRMAQLTQSNEELEKSLSLSKYADQFMSRPDVIEDLSLANELELTSEDYTDFIKRMPEAEFKS